MIEDLGGKFDPETIGVDFEQAFINALRECFPNAKIIGCLFHWKQAIRRKMIGLGIPKVVVSYFMRPGMLDLLTVLPPEDIATINSKDLIYVAALMEGGLVNIVMEDGAKIPVCEWIKSDRLDDGNSKMVKFWDYVSK